MFRFGFADPKAEAADPAAPSDGLGEAALDHIGAEEVPDSESKPTGAQETVLISSELSLIKGVVSNAQAASILSDDRVEENDLIAGVYEGGFKTWEGGLDLAQFVALQMEQRRTLGQQGQAAEGQQANKEQQQSEEEEQQQQQQEGQWAAQLGAGSRVMELGCGHGLPGLVALWAGAEVHFQDYNRSVLTTLTMQNVAANRNAWATRRQAAVGARGTAAGPAAAAASASSPADAAGARYFAGSWDALPGLLRELGLQHSYELVLTAETIYSLEAMRSLYHAIKACLRPGAGVALVAAKSYYFGVGGGTAAFTKLVHEEGCFSCKQVAVIDDGASNKREILLLSPLPA